jgi:ATP-dependent RNA helicase DDX56/DBP9
MEDAVVTWATQEYGLDKRLVKACKKAGWLAPTLVQQSAIPLILQGKDVLCRARTGAGKTAAYLLPLLQKILDRKQGGSTEAAVRALVLVPTNELCEQVCAQLEELLYYAADQVSVLSLAPAAVPEGGKSRSKSQALRAQAVLLRACPDVVVATPARANLHLAAGALLLVAPFLETLVVDEADLVLSFGHGDDMRAIAASLPAGGASCVQGVLMSATLSPQLNELKRLVLHAPAVLKLEDGDEGGGGKLLQFFVTLLPEDKYLLVYVFLRLGLLQGKGILFVNTIDEAYKLRLFLSKFSIRAAALNSKLPLTSRTHILDEFNRGIFDLLIATDEGLGQAMPDSEDESEAEDGSGLEEVGSDEDEEGGSGGSDEDDVLDGSDEDENEELEEEKEEEASNLTKRPKADKAEKAAEADAEDGEEYGVVRGVDFKGVNFVVNVDMPRSADAYTHRVGRTARAGASGTALTLVSSVPRDGELKRLAEVQAQQPPLPTMGGDSALAAMGPVALQGPTGHGGQAQPAPLAFDLGELESFRYRVTDMLRAVSKVAVREERQAELKRELLNSEKLREYFALNPGDLKTLRHDKRAVPSQKQDTLHLAHVPDYLVPTSLRAATGADARYAPGASRKRRRKADATSGSSDPRRNKAGDPLQSFVANPAGGKAEAVKLYSKSDDAGAVLSGRRAWKQRHAKGEYSKGTKPSAAKAAGFKAPGSASQGRAKKR